MLLDVAHLKVSSNSLGFDRNKIFSKCDQWIKAYHFSDNDGFSDTNGPIDKSSWFINYFDRNLENYTLEVYNVSVRKIKKQLDYLNDLIN